MNNRNQVLTSYNHSIMDAFNLSWSSSCNYFEPGLFREGIIFERGSLLLLASVSHSLLLFRITLRKPSLRLSHFIACRMTGALTKKGSNALSSRNPPCSFLYLHQCFLLLFLILFCCFFADWRWQQKASPPASLASIAIAARITASIAA